MGGNWQVTKSSQMGENIRILSELFMLMHHAGMGLVLLIEMI